MPPNKAINWSAEMDGAFSATKKALVNAAMLAHPLPVAPIVLTTNASDYAVGTVFEQGVNGAWQPLPFFSRPTAPQREEV